MKVFKATGRRTRHYNGITNVWRIDNTVSISFSETQNHAYYFILGSTWKKINGKYDKKLMVLFLYLLFYKSQKIKSNCLKPTVFTKHTRGNKCKLSGHDVNQVETLNWHNT